MLESSVNKLRKLEPHKANYVDPLNILIDQLDDALAPDYIAGFQLVWVSATAINILPGVAWVSGKGRLKVSATVSKTGISLGASTWGHVYLYYDSALAVPAIEIVTTAPTSAGFGSAYQKTGDATRRYLGSIRTDASGNILNFYHFEGTRILYRSDVNARLILNGGTATGETNVSCSGFVPATSRVAILHLQNTATNTTNMWIGAGSGASDDSVSPPTTGLQVVGSGGMKGWVGDVPINASQQFSYAFNVAPTGGSGFAYIYGYSYDR